MKNIFLLTFISVLFWFPKATAQESKDWTLLVYIVGSDLESGSDAATTDIAEMIAGATTTDYVNVVILTGGANKPGWETPRSFLIENGQQTELDFKPTSDNMANPDNVVQFINWGTENYPAQNYMLTFWNHGGDLRGFGWVDGTEDHLSINQIQTALDQSKFITDGNLFEVIGFDACLMANLEVQSMLQYYANYYVGSEETEPGHGWNWTPIVKAMEGGEATFGDQLGTIIVDSYKQHAEDEETYNSGVTLSLINLAEIANLEDKLKLLLDKISTDHKEPSLQKAISASEEYGKSIQDPETSSDVVDLGDLVRQLKKLDPELSSEADAVKAALESTVVHHINDGARPKASGITIYMPHNVLNNDDELNYVINDVYTPLNLESSVKNFVINNYVPYVQSDNSAPNNFTSSNQSSPVRRNDSFDYSALTLIHDNNIEQVSIVLEEEIGPNSNEYILLGSTFADSIVIEDDTTTSYYYFWDGLWLGINGFPAYIADIHEYELEDEDGNTTLYNRIHIPAILNNDTPEEKNIMIGYRFDEHSNITLESIMAEHKGNGSSRVVPKERIKLKPGDKIQLLYKIYNEDTDEEYFYEKPGAVVDITTGKEDLHLEYGALDEGTYYIGYLIQDHFFNDTIVFDDYIYQVISTSNNEIITDHQIQMYPNPADQGFYVTTSGLPEATNYVVSLTDAMGRIVYTSPIDHNVYINTNNLPSGIYTVSLKSKYSIIANQIVIQH